MFKPQDILELFPVGFMQTTVLSVIWLTSKELTLHLWSTIGLGDGAFWPLKSDNAAYFRLLPLLELMKEEAEMDRNRRNNNELNLFKFVSYYNY